MAVQGVPLASDAPGLLAARPAPAPLLWPTIGFLGGVGAADAIGRLDPGPLCALVILMFGGTVLAIRFRRALVRNGVWLALATAGVGLPAGFVRFQAELNRPAGHISRVLGAEPILTRVEGRVLTAPIDSSAELRNPYFRGALERRAAFLLGLQRVTSGSPPTAAEGVLRVRVDLPPQTRASDLRCDIGDELELTGWLYPIPGRRNPGETDWCRVQWLAGVDAGITVREVEQVRRLRPAATGLQWLRARLRGAARGLLLDTPGLADHEDASRLLDAMVLGQRSATARRIDEAFVRAGGIHFLSVSGFHVAVLLASAWWLMTQVFGRSHRSAGVLATGLLILYLLVAETNAPVLRSGIAALLLVVAIWLSRSGSSLNWLALTALLIAAWNPREALRPGYQLSFVQVGGLLLLHSPIRRALFPGRSDRRSFLGIVFQSLWRQSVVALVLSVALWLLSMPLVLLHFGRLTMWGALGALLLTPVVTVLLWLSFATLLAATVSSAVAAWLSHGISTWTLAMLTMVEALAQLPGANFLAWQPPAWLVAATYLGLLLLWTSRHPRRRAPGRGTRRGPRRPRRRPAFLLIGIGAGWAIWVVGALLRHRGESTLVVLDIPRGAARVFVEKDGDAVVLGAGSRGNFDAASSVQTALRELGAARVVAVVAPVAEAESISGLPSLALAWPTTVVWATPALHDVLGSRIARRFSAQVRDRGAPYTLANENLHIEIGRSDLRVIWPPADRPDLLPLEQSLIVRHRLQDYTLLYVDRLSIVAMQSLVARVAAGTLDLQSDVVVLSGAPNAAGVEFRNWLATVNPQELIVTDPPATALREFLSSGPIRCQLWPTTEVGAVMIKLHSDGGLVVSAEHLSEITTLAPRVARRSHERRNATGQDRDAP